MSCIQVCKILIGSKKGKKKTKKREKAKEEEEEGGSKQQTNKARGRSLHRGRGNRNSILGFIALFRVIGVLDSPAMFSSKNGAGMMMVSRPVFLDEVFTRKLDLSSTSSSSSSLLLNQFNKSHEGF